MSAITFDESHYPLIVAKFPNDATDDECRQYAYDAAAICKKYKKDLLWMVDARLCGSNIMKKSKRDAIAETFREVEDIFNSAVIARAHVVNSKLEEGAFTAFFWLLKSKANSPKKFFSNYDEAVKWLMTHKK